MFTAQIIQYRFGDCFFMYNLYGVLS